LDKHFIVRNCLGMKTFLANRNAIAFLFAASPFLPEKDACGGRILILRKYAKM
jgi:hypothetical protein